MARYFLSGCVEHRQYQATHVGIGKIGCNAYLMIVLTIGQELDGLPAYD
ncbi:hypothetical protein XOC_0035 [Xanthomonas oryzae pv. oryzicola BLS256]|uniref:Uncharacterized protein n=1 Tax=Xanthomonas oryzae pv. oryzicola (strain BLS256) TaxID=383407 RepID=G7THW8_XANOB|nr:hypothetical protein XOC_0035 [Xanthomonas oryzae pv. oryzicola BLS256]